MSGDESQSGVSQPSRKLKLVLKTSPVSTPGEVRPENTANSKDASSSPPRPSYSPVTPTLSHENRLSHDKPEPPNLIDEPASLPLSLDENADAIALRATLSLLQMQRQQSLKDIRDLDKLKDAALRDPQAFADDLRTGKLSKSMTEGITFDDVEYDSDDDTPETATNTSSKFTRLPQPQNIARCPPIEWSKYHVLDKPLHDMHETQKQYPGSLDNNFTNGSGRKEYDIAAPYRPFKDKLNEKDS